MLKFLKKIRNLIFRALYTSAEMEGVEQSGPKLLGSLTPDQLKAIFSVLPVDLAFVDERDLNRFVLLGVEPVFDRDEGIIGMPVNDCHSEHSQPMVQNILDEFRAGNESRCDFWLNHKGRFIHIQYLAIRNPSGKYLGTLEFIYDGTRTRELEGERHELVYE